MVAIVEPKHDKYEAEHRYMFNAKDPSGPHVVISGSVGLDSIDPDAQVKGDDDDVSEVFAVRLHVGPFWQDVDQVVPKVTIDEFYSHDSDDVDHSRWSIYGLAWDTTGEHGPNNNEDRIRLKFTVEVQGFGNRLRRLGYYVFARGRNLGDGGLLVPGPVHG